MRFSEHYPSWELRLGIPEDLNFAVAVRASYDLAPIGLSQLVAAPLHDGFDPPVAISDRSEVSAQWSRWWIEMTVDRREEPLGPGALDPPDFETLSSSPQLQEACRQIWPQYHRWWQGMHGRKRRLAATLRELDTLPGQLVADYEHRKRRRARPFRFDIEVLTVDSMHSVVIDDAYAQIGTRLVADPAAFTNWFRPILRRIG